MAKTSIKRPSGPRLSLGGDSLETGADPAAPDGPATPLIAVSAMGTLPAPVGTSTAAPTIAVGGGWVFPAPISAPSPSSHSIVVPPPPPLHLHPAPPAVLPPLLPPPNLNPEKNTLTIEVIKTNSSSPTPSLPKQYLNFYNGPCHPSLAVAMAAASTPPPPSSSPFPPPPSLSPLVAHRLAGPSRVGPPAQSNAGTSSHGLIGQSSHLNNNNNNNNPEPWDSFKDVKPDVGALCREEKAVMVRKSLVADARHFSAAKENAADMTGDRLAASKGKAVELSSEIASSNASGSGSSSSVSPAGDTPMVTDPRPKKRKRKNSGRAV